MNVKKVPSPGLGKVRSGCYLLHFSKVRGLRKGSFLGTMLEPTLEAKSGVESSIKTSSENIYPYYEMLVPFGGHVLSERSIVCRSKMILICGPMNIVILTPSGHPNSLI